MLQTMEIRKRQEVIDLYIYIYIVSKYVVSKYIR